MPPPSEKIFPAFLEGLLSTLADRQENVLEESLKRSGNLLGNITQTTFSRLVNEIVEATGCAEITAAAALRSVTLLAGWVASNDEDGTDTTAIFETIQKITAARGKGLTGEEQLRLRKALDRLEKTPETRRAFARDRAKRGVLPAFQSLDATLELRSTQLPSQLEDDPPVQPLELVPIASIRLDLDSGDPDFICFQATEEDLELLQEKIGKLREGLRKLMERVQVKPQ